MPDTYIKHSNSHNNFLLNITIILSFVVSMVYLYSAIVLTKFSKLSSRIQFHNKKIPLPIVKKAALITWFIKTYMLHLQITLINKTRSYLTNAESFLNVYLRKFLCSKSDKISNRLSIFNKYLYRPKVNIPLLSG